MESPFLTVAETAAYLRVDPQTVRRWCAEGVIPHSRIGSVIRIARADLDAVARAAR